jgi:hypothetical protein
LADDGQSHTAPFDQRRHRDFMNQDPITALVEITRATTIFDRIADDLIAGVRHAMGVPPRAEVEVEEEFAFLRASLDVFLPEFRQLYGGLLVKHLGWEEVPEVLEGLESEVAQRYLCAVEGIEAELQQHLGRLSQEMLLEAQASLSLAQDEAHRPKI